MRMTKLIGRMAEKGVTQGVLASALGVSINTVSNKLNMRSFFTTDQVVTICDLLDITDPKEMCDIFLVLPS